MKVYLDDTGEKRILGRAEVPEAAGAVFALSLSGAASTIVERFTIGTVTHLSEGGGVPAVARMVLLHLDQRRELLPRWQPLAS